jgi:hypothetical protein
MDITITNDQELEEWLANQPRYLSQVVGVRAALRTLPFVSIFFERDQARAQRLAVATFRASVIAWTSIRYRETLKLERPAIAAVRAVRDARASTKMLSRSARPMLAAEHAIQCIAYPESVLSHAAAAAFASAAVAGDYAARLNVEEISRESKARDQSEGMWKAISSDVNKLVRSSNSEVIDLIASQPLWSNDPPAIITKQLKELRSRWGQIDENSTVWVDWLVSRIYGGNSFGMGREDSQWIDFQVSSQDRSWWQTDPREVSKQFRSWVSERSRVGFRKAETISDLIEMFLENSQAPMSISEIHSEFLKIDYPIIQKSLRGQLSRMSAEGKIARVGRGLYSSALYRLDIPAVEPQTAGAIQFESVDAGLIRVRRGASVGDLRLDESARRRHHEVKRRIAGIIEQFSVERTGANSAKNLLDEIGLFFESLGDEVEYVDADLMIPRGDGLRKDVVAYLNRDDFSSLPPVPDDLVLSLEKAVVSYNNYVSFDPELARRDEALLGPDARRRLVPPAEGQSVLEDAVDRRAAEKGVVEILAEEAKVAPVIPDAESRQSRRYSEGTKNFARAAVEQAIEFAGSIRRGAVNVIGVAVTGYAAAQWVMANESWLLRYFAENPAMLNIIQRLMEILKTLPIA